MHDRRPENTVGSRGLQPLRRGAGVPADHVVTGDRRFCPRCRDAFGPFRTVCLERSRQGELIGLAFHCHGPRLRPGQVPADRLAEILAAVE